MERTVIKREERLLEVFLSDEEVRVKGERIAVLNGLMRTKADDLKDHNKTEKAEIKVLDTEFNSICREIAYGKERRSVGVVLELDESDWKVYTRRIDTDEIISERAATEKEMQKDLFDSASTADEALGSPEDVIQGEPVTDEEVAASVSEQFKKIPGTRVKRFLKPKPTIDESPVDGDAA